MLSYVLMSLDEFTSKKTDVLIRLNKNIGLRPLPAGRDRALFYRRAAVLVGRHAKAPFEGAMEVTDISESTGNRDVCDSILGPGQQSRRGLGSRRYRIRDQAHTGVRSKISCIQGARHVNATRHIIEINVRIQMAYYPLYTSSDFLLGARLVGFGLKSQYPNMVHQKLS
jgi:hypothetical protein